MNDKMAVGEAGEDLKKLATVLLDETEGGKPAEAAEPAKPAAAAEKKPEPAAAPAEPAAPAVAAATGGNGVAAASENGEVRLGAAAAVAAGHCLHADKMEGLGKPALLARPGSFSMVAP